MRECFNCGKKGNEIHRYTVCGQCKTKLRLFSDRTIEKYYARNPEGFSRELKKRLDFIEKDYIKKKIKLLHALEKIKRGS